MHECGWLLRSACREVRSLVKMYRFHRISLEFVAWSEDEALEPHGNTEYDGPSSFICIPS